MGFDKKEYQREYMAKKREQSNSMLDNPEMLDNNVRQLSVRQTDDRHERLLKPIAESLKSGAHHSAFDRYTLWKAAKAMFGTLSSDNWPYLPELAKRDGVTPKLVTPAKVELDRFGVKIRPRICTKCPGLTFPDLPSHADHLMTHNPSPEAWANAYELIQRKRERP